MFSLHSHSYLTDDNESNNSTEKKGIKQSHRLTLIDIDQITRGRNRKRWRLIVTYLYNFYQKKNNQIIQHWWRSSLPAAYPTLNSMCTRQVKAFMRWSTNSGNPPMKNFTCADWPVHLNYHFGVSLNFSKRESVEKQITTISSVEWLKLTNLNSWFSHKVTATICWCTVRTAKKYFAKLEWHLELCCAPTLPSHHVGENQEYYHFTELN